MSSSRPPVVRWLAPGASATLCPVQPARKEALPPPLDEHIVEPESTREELVRGRRIVAMPALPPHADRHYQLDYVTAAHLKPEYEGSTDMLARVSLGSDFATDTSIRPKGEHGEQLLQEIAFEVVNTQTLQDVTLKPEDLQARGVRRIFGIFVKEGKVKEWKGGWHVLPPDSFITDECLVGPLPVKALLVSGEADNAVAQALVVKNNPVIVQLREKAQAQTQAQALLTVLSARGLPVSNEIRQRIEACDDLPTLTRWLTRAVLAASAAEAIAS